MEQAKNNGTAQNPSKIFCKQPISCPWIPSQPYQSVQNKNRPFEASANKSLPNTPIPLDPRPSNEKNCPSLQHSSSQFFYFLRLMQLFPETHPATLHTVLYLCKNDFFCAVDKLLYAKRCKTLYARSQNMFKRTPTPSNRNHPYCNGMATAKNLAPYERVRSVVDESDAQEVRMVVESTLGTNMIKKVDANDSDVPSNLVLKKDSTLKTLPIQQRIFQRHPRSLPCRTQLCKFQRIRQRLEFIPVTS